MKKDDAIAALETLSAVERIAVAQLNADDVLVIELNTRVSMDTIERIRATMEQIWPGRKVVIFEQGIRLKIVEASQVAG